MFVPVAWPAWGASDSFRCSFPLPRSFWSVLSLRYLSVIALEEPNKKTQGKIALSKKLNKAPKRFHIVFQLYMYTICGMSALYKWITKLRHSHLPEATWCWIQRCQVALSSNTGYFGVICSYRYVKTCIGNKLGGSALYSRNTILGHFRSPKLLKRLTVCIYLNIETWDMTI